MENQEIIVLVSVAVAVFSIILFCKTWGMTNDVRWLRNFVYGNSVTSSKSSREIEREVTMLTASGKKKEAIELIIKLFCMPGEYGKAEAQARSLFESIHEPLPKIIASSKTWDQFNAFIAQGYDVYSKNITENS